MQYKDYKLVVDGASLEEALKVISKEGMIAVDTETNSLDMWRDDTHIIGVSVYCPKADFSYYFACGHGKGRFSDVQYDTAMSWNKESREAFTQHVYENMVETNHANLDEAEMGKLFKELAKHSWVLHNAKFDMHYLVKAGCELPSHIEDTMVLLHTIQDWRSIEVEAPIKDSETGRWVRDSEGNFVRKPQFGNRQLKWQAAYWEFDYFWEGEEELEEAIEEELEHWARTVSGNYYNMYMDVAARHTNAKEAAKEIKEMATRMGLSRITFYKDVSRWDDPKQLDAIKKKLVLDSKATMWVLPPERVAGYACLDTKFTWQLRETLIPSLDIWDNHELYNDMNRINRIAYEMERNGFIVDKEEALTQLSILEARIDEVRGILEELALSEAGLENFNPNSPAQLKDFLNAVLQEEFVEYLPDWVSPEMRADTETYHIELNGANKEAFELVENHALVRLIQEYRRMTKAAGTYLDKWLNATGDDGRIHPSFWVDGTVTGRFSSGGDAGNFQNIPDRGGYTIKRALRTFDGWTLYAMDYSQMELRLASYVAEQLLQFETRPDRMMSQLYIEGKDVHSHVRDVIDIRRILWGDMSDEAVLVALGYKLDELGDLTPEKAVANEARQRAKTVNFGLLYSGTYYMLSKVLRVNHETARKIEEEWRSLFPAFAKAQNYYEDLSTQWRPTPDGSGIGMYATAPLSGRHRKLHMLPDRWIWDSKSKRNYNPVKSTKRKVWNSVVQGLGGQLTNYAAVMMREEFSEDELLFHAQIHDALEFSLYGAHEENIPKLQRIYEIATCYPTEPKQHVEFEVFTQGNWFDKREIKGKELWQTK